MRRPYVSFAEVKEKVPIPEALVALGVVERFTRKGETLTGVCPLPEHAHGPSPNPEQFKINRREGIWLWHCFGDCQRGGDVVELVKAMTGYDDAHVRFWFAEKFGDRLSLGKSKAGKRQVETNTARVDLGQGDQAQAASLSKPILPTPTPPLKPLRFRLDLDPDVPYLRQRGLTDETIRQYGLGLCRRGVLKGYVAIPVHGYPSQPGDPPLAYLGRSPGEDYDEGAGRPRYKWPDGFLKNRVVYGLREAMAAQPAGPLIVVEGPFKVFYLVQAGFATAVAVCGATLSDEQADILVGTGRRLLLCFDGDEAGQRGMRAAAGKLIARSWTRVAKLPDGTEPDMVPAEQLRNLLGTL